MKTMQIAVRRVEQMTGGGSHVVIFDAELEFLSTGRSTVEVIAVNPIDVETSLVQQACRAILQGAEHALSSRGMAAHVRVNSLTIQPTDFKAHRFSMLTTAAIQREFDKSAESVPPE